MGIAGECHLTCGESHVEVAGESHVEVNFYEFFPELLMHIHRPLLGIHI